MNSWWLLVPLSYLVGAFPTAHLIGRFTDTDPTLEGSGNPGASNMYRVAGKRAGAAVLVGDALKGLVPTLIGLWVGGRALGLACGVAAMVGHVLPVTRGFRGGKGVATLTGACVVLYPLVSLCLLATWSATIRLSRTASVASLVIAILLPIGVALRGRPSWEVAVTAAAAAVIVVRHRTNIARIARNEERVMPS